MNSSMSFTATGDSFITRRVPDKKSEAFQTITNIINKGEFRFTNFEVTAHNFEGFPSAASGGTWAIAEPAVLQDIKDYGFNTLAWANNHTLDYSYGGLEATAKYMNDYGFVHAGVGRNLADANAPKYIDCPSGRVALIAATSTFHESWIAGEQRPDVAGRPGVNPLRFESRHVLSKEKIEQLKEIARLTDINADYNLAVREGFEVAPKANTFKFGENIFEVGDDVGKSTYPLQTDLDRIKNSINEANRQADYVIVSIHTHEMSGEEKDQAPEFLEIFSRACIDEGAHAVLGHGPHILRGIEVYKDRPIFYSLGNFIFQNDTVSNLPHDFYTKYNLDFNHNVADALDKRSDNGKKGLGVNPAVWESVIPYWKMKDGKLVELKLYPIDLGDGLPRYSRGWPTVSDSVSVLEDLNKLSIPYGTTIEIVNGVGVIR